MPQEFLTAIAFLAPGIAAGIFYAAHQGSSPKAWVYLGYASAFTALDIAFVMGMVLVIRGQNYLLAAEIGQVEIYLFVLLLSIAGAAGFVYRDAAERPGRLFGQRHVSDDRQRES